MSQIPRRLRSILSLDDLEEAARRHLPRPVFGYVSGAVEENLSYRDNRAAFDDYAIVPRVLVDVSKRTQSVELFGHAYASPFGVAPMGISALSAYRGDIVQARAARANNVPMIMSASSLIPMEQVIAEYPALWFQAYLPGDTKRIDPLIDRVAAAGFTVLVVTVDVPVAGNRENNVRTGFSTPLVPTLRLAWDGITRPRWLLGTFARTLLNHGMPHFENNFAERGTPIVSKNVMRDFSARDHLDWRHIEAIRKRWKGKFVLKGILHPDDARRAVAAGIDGVIVSNHGGRQLDSAIAPLRALPAVKEASGGMTVMIDSGIRRGTHVLKALALGADFAFVGRPFNYAAAIGGEAGVSHAIALLRDEVDRDLAMMGACNCGELNPEMLRRR